MGRHFHRSVLLLLVSVLSSIPAFAIETADEYLLKSAYLYKFAYFVQWPDPVSDNFHFCVLGQNPFGDHLRSLEGKQIASVSTKVTVLTEPSEAKACQVLYMNPASHSQMVKWLEELTKLPVLIISDKPNAFEEGATIALQTEPNRVAFRINLSKAKNVGLTIRAQLLQLADEVR